MKHLIAYISNVQSTTFVYLIFCCFCHFMCVDESVNLLELKETMCSVFFSIYHSDFAVSIPPVCRSNCQYPTKKKK